MTYINIPNSTLNRDMGSRALVETDRRKAEEYKAKAAMMNNVKSVQNQIDDLRNELTEIKELLRGLVK